jgi:transcription antitermination factor NusG
MKSEVYEWYVVYTRQGMEKKVAKELNKQQIECYCPVSKVEQKWWSLKRNAEQPLFTSYVFVKISETQVSQLKKVSGVVNVLYWLGKPAVVNESEINMLRSFLGSHTCVSVEKTTVKSFNYVSSNSDQSYKIELPTLGFSIVAKDAYTSKVIPMPVIATAKLQPQYSNAG